MNAVEIRTERLILKPMSMQYLETVFEYSSDPETTRFMVWLPNKKPEDAVHFLENAEREWEKEKPDAYEFAILKDDVQIGAVSCYIDAKDRSSAELGWILNKKYWGQGIATEAADALMKFAFSQVGVRHFIAHCDAENRASSRVMEKIGMKKKDEYGGRKNASSGEERRECLYEKYMYPVRVMSAADYDKVYELWMSCKNMGFNNLDDSREGIDRYLRRNPTTSFVAQDGDKVIGVLMAGHDGRRGLIHHMAVREEYRGRGIASDLLEHALEALKNEGINKVACMVFRYNEAGNAFWERQGFTAREDLWYRNKALAEMIRIDT